MLHVFCVRETNPGAAQSGGRVWTGTLRVMAMLAIPDVSSGLAFGVRGFSAGREDARSFR